MSNPNYFKCPFHGNLMPKGLVMKYGAPFFDHCDESCFDWKKDDYCWCGEHKKIVHEPSVSYKVCINKTWWKPWHEKTKIKHACRLCAGLDSEFLEQ